MFKKLVPVLALVAMIAPTPTAAASDVTDVSAQRRSAGKPALKKPAKPALRRSSGKSKPAVSRSVGKPAVSRSFGKPGSVSPLRSAVPGGRPGFGRGPAGARGISVGVAPGVGLRPSRLGVGPGRIVAGPARLGGIPTVALRNNKFATVYRGPRRIYWGGRWRAFVPLAALGVVVIGSAYYYPDAYLVVARPYCEGVTPNGCRLNWQRVGFEDGDGEWQCVQFCRRPGAIPPPRTVALAAPPPPAEGRCEITIYSEPKFASNAVPTGDDQPNLGESGWQNQIASVEVKAGTWEMFTEEQYSGNAIRLGPGSYPELEPDWMKKINSFMCVEPSN
jgi:hypothetical protein